MAFRHKKNKEQRYDEGYVRGKRACLIGIFPIFIFLGIMMAGAWVIYDFYNKMVVNQGNSDICMLVRQHYTQTVHPNYPCDLVEKDKFWLVEFNANPGVASTAPIFISFKVDKKSKQISPGYDVK